MTTYIGLLGRNIAYSLSPKLQGAALTAAGLDWEYQLLATEPENFQPAVDKLRNPRWAGANVTVPYKQAILSLLDVIDISAEPIGAVNTIVNTKGMLTGYNTDSLGLARDLDRLGISLKDREVVIVGAGGGAAAALALAQQGRNHIVCRNKAQGLALVKRLKIYALVLPWQQMPPCDVLINCTPPNSGWRQLVNNTEVIYDLNYHEPKPPWRNYHNGMGMLLFQGAEAFRLWTGLDPSLEKMAGALGLRL